MVYYTRLYNIYCTRLDYKTIRYFNIVFLTELKTGSGLLDRVSQMHRASRNHENLHDAYDKKSSLGPLVQLCFTTAVAGDLFRILALETMLMEISGLGFSR